MTTGMAWVVVFGAYGAGALLLAAAGSSRVLPWARRLLVGLGALLVAPLVVACLATVGLIVAWRLTALFEEPWLIVQGFRGGPEPGY